MSEKIVKVIDLVPGKVAALQSIAAADLSPELFRSKFVDLHQPLLIKGAAKAWPALQRWSEPGYLEARCAGEQVQMSRRFNPAQAEAYRHTVTRRNLVDCFADLRGARDDQTVSVPAFMLPAGWAADLGGYPFLGALDKKPMMYPRARLFMYRNASSEWHYHPFDESITTQLAGSKRISLFRLDAATWQPHSSLIESNFHHLERGHEFFPPESALTKLEGTLEAGDSVYIPPFWWHGIDPADSALGMTLAYCFRSPVHRLGAWQDPVTRRVLQRMAANRKLALPAALAMLGYSTLRRKMAGVAW